MSKQITMILTNEFNPDPRVYKEAVYFVARGFNVTILCWDRGISDLPEYEIKDGIEVIRFKIPSVYGSGFKQFGAFFKYILACRKYLKTHHCDYLHCNDLDGTIIEQFARR